MVLEDRGIKTNSSARFSQIRSFFYRKIKTATKDSLLLAGRWLGPRPMGNELMEIGSFSRGVAAPDSCFFFSCDLRNFSNDSFCCCCLLNTFLLYFEGCPFGTEEGESDFINQIRKVQRRQLRWFMATTTSWHPVVFHEGSQSYAFFFSV